MTGAIDWSLAEKPSARGVGRWAWTVGGLCLAVQGCAFSYVDSNNVRHVVGFVDITLPVGKSDEASSASSAVSVTSVGVHVYSGRPNGGGFMLGYSKETVLLVPNNACVDIETPGVCANRASAVSQSNGGTSQP